MWEDTEMRVDPRSCKCEVKENLLWALLHDIIVHPLLGFTLYRAEWAIRLHDYTSHKAWPRPVKLVEGEPVVVEISNLEAFNELMNEHLPPGFFAEFPEDDLTEQMIKDGGPFTDYVRGGTYYPDRERDDAELEKWAERLAEDITNHPNPPKRRDESR